MGLDAIITGIGAVAAAAGGIILVVRELRRRDRRAYQREIDELTDELHILREDFVAWRRYTFALREQMADRGLDVPDAPQPHHLVQAEPTEAIIKRRLFQRHRDRHHEEEE